VNYWSIPAACKTAIDGTWIKGPGEKLTNAIMESIGDAKIIAEDLGVLTKPVLDLIKKTGFPGMKILEFGLDGPADNAYLPHNFTSNNIVAYLGTHDNETLVGYLNGRNRKQRGWIKDYCGVRRSKDIPAAIIRSLYACVADVAVIQMQDMLLLGNEARMNKPSTVGSNWKWRMKQSDYEKVDAAEYKRLGEAFNR
jgi:4-alpha-glucanotransferase